VSGIGSGSSRYGHTDAHRPKPIPTLDDSGRSCAGDPMKNGRVRWLAGILGLMGAGMLLARPEPVLEFTTTWMPRAEGQFYRLGLRFGTVDGNAGEDYSLMFAQDPLALVVYLEADAPDYVWFHPAAFPPDKRAQARMVRHASRLAAQIENGGPRQQRRDTKAFLAGYRVGNSLGQLRQSIKRKVLE
jgi:hypothetical protein